MSLPAWTPAGLLPPGAHRASLTDLYERFVLDAPCREHRETLYAALTVHLRLIQRIIPAGRAWINGSFCTSREAPPNDVDVVIHPAEWTTLDHLPEHAKPYLYALLTLQDVVVAQPTIWLSRLQPVGGVIDAFLCRPGHEATWHDQWSKVTDAGGTVVEGKTKGYAEVAW